MVGYNGTHYKEGNPDKYPWENQLEQKPFGVTFPLVLENMTCVTMAEKAQGWWRDCEVANSPLYWLWPREEGVYWLCQ